MEPDNLVNKINIDDISKEIYLENIANRVLDDFPNFHDLGKTVQKEGLQCRNFLDGNIEQMAINADNRAFRTISSHRKVLGPIIIFCKRVIRKILKWYIEPFCDQQSAFNHNAVASIKYLNENLGQLSKLDNDVVEQKNENKRNIEFIMQNVKCLDSDVKNSIKSVYDRIQLLEETLYQYKLENEQYKSIQIQQAEDLKNNLKFYEKNISEDKKDKQLIFENIIATVSNFNKFIEQRNNVDLDMITERIFNNLRQEKYDIYSIIENNPKYQFGKILSSSQSGEDLIVAYILDCLGIPFNQCSYLDIGANHPRSMNNTYFFYCFGARGVLVEANPDLIDVLKEYRNGDIILNKCISTTTGGMEDFYILNGDGLSTINQLRVENILKDNELLKIKKIIQVKTISVEDIYDAYFEKVPLLVSLDIEGYEMEILKTMGLRSKRPLIIIIETIAYKNGLSMEGKNREIINFMNKMDYIEYAFTGINSIFLDKNNSIFHKNKY